MKCRFGNIAKRAGKLAVIFLALAIMLSTAHSALSFKYGDGILGLDYFYQLEDDTVDVLILGSSHAFENFNTGVLYDSYGIAAYVLAGSVQPYWNTYYYLAEALKTQKPKLIVLESYASALNAEYSDHSRIIKNNLGIRDIMTRYQSLKISSPEEELENYIFDYRLWHSRYSELSRSDFQKYYQQPKWQFYRGFGINFSTKSFDRPEVDSADTTAPLREKEEEYYRKIIELTIEKEIPLMIVAAPYILDKEAQQRFNMSHDIAEEYGVEYINFNSSFYYDAMGLDFSSDFADENHMNYRGNVKFTDVFAEEALSRYSIPERRGDEAYKSWETHSRDVLGRIEGQYLRGEKELYAYLDRLRNGDYTVALITISQTDAILGEYSEKLAELGMDLEEIHDGSLYVIQNSGIDYWVSELCWEYQCDLDDNTLAIAQSADETITHSIVWNGTERLSAESGCYFVVYDNSSDELVEVSNFGKDGNRQA